MLRGRDAAIYLRDRQQRDSDDGLIAESPRRMLCTARLNRGRHENGSFQRNEIGLTMMGLYLLVSENSWIS